MLFITFVFGILFKKYNSTLNATSSLPWRRSVDSGTTVRLTLQRFRPSLLQVGKLAVEMFSYPLEKPSLEKE